MTSIERVAVRRQQITDELRGVRRARPQKSVPLSPRESEIVALIAEGRQNKEIAGTLGISQRTVKFHVRAAFGKTGATDRLGLVLWSLRQVVPEVVEVAIEKLLTEARVAEVREKLRLQVAAGEARRQARRRARVVRLESDLLDVRRRRRMGLTERPLGNPEDPPCRQKSASCQA